MREQVAPLLREARVRRAPPASGRRRAARRRRAALAADCPKTTLGDVEDEVMCPVCGTPLGLATEAPQAQRERAYIQRLIDACRSKDEIKRALVAQFGDCVLALPGDERHRLRGRARLRHPRPRRRARGRRHRRRPPPLAPPRRDRPRAAAPAPDSNRLDADMERYDL